MTKKEITEAIAAKIEAGEDRPDAIAAEILNEYRARMFETIRMEAEKALRKLHG